MTRYRTSDVPPEGAGAFMPVPTTTPAASSYGLVEVYGAPGTEPVPAPSPQHVGYLPSLTRQAAPNTAQSSDCAPDVILPAIYVASAVNMGPAADGIGMWRRRFCELPIPAADPTRIPNVAQKVPRQGGRATMAWPRAFQRFPLIGSGAGS